MKTLLKFTSLLAVVAGILMIAGGAWAINFTYENVSRENIITPSDASIPNTIVRGPLTLKSQADIIRAHALRSAGGQTYAEMPRQIPKTDQKGDPILDGEGNIIMVANEARNTWVTATVLITALNLGIVTYLFSGLIVLLGLISVWTGLIFYTISKKT